MNTILYLTLTVHSGENIHWLICQETFSSCSVYGQPYDNFFGDGNPNIFENEEPKYNFKTLGQLLLGEKYPGKTEKRGHYILPSMPKAHAHKNKQKKWGASLWEPFRKDMEEMIWTTSMEIWRLQFWFDLKIRLIIW